MSLSQPILVLFKVDNCNYTLLKINNCYISETHRLTEKFPQIYISSEKYKLAAKFPQI
jgi:hypothetical protein